MRRCFVCGNWKMNKTVSEAAALIRELRGSVSMVRDRVEIAVAPAFPALGAVAKAANTSTFYFCKMFKKAVGINFTDYLSRVRIEKAKNLLLNPNLRISEIAFEVGFQSLTHFNRVFKKIVGQSPTEYREKLPSA